MKKTCKLRVYIDKQNKYRWTFIAKNGKKIADGAQGYTRKEKCLHGFDVMADFIGDGDYTFVDDCKV